MAHVVKRSVPPPAGGGIERIPIMGRERACMILEGGRAYCVDPVEGPMQLLARKWALFVITVLGNAPSTRFNEAKRAIPGITARALSDRLHDLVDAGLAARDVDASSAPPAVAYRLTAKGQTMRQALIPLIEWASEERPI